ncbi:MAG: peptide deformylase [Candidatus Krumholzibacteria bacterium]|nr:peptide deformylase [Candidatus Krumholzibacteria bacterium]
MAILKVARMGHPVLREKCKPIDPNQITGPEVQRLIRDMLETMFEYNGVGLAAPQVYTPVRLAIAGGEVDQEGRPRLRVLINPEITVLDKNRREGMYEGCLSVPGLRGYVERPAHIRVQAFNEKGQRIDLELEGYPAIVMQHECDHLDGILYVDRIEDPSKLGFEEEVHRYHDLGERDDDGDDDDDDNDDEDDDDEEDD